MADLFAAETMKGEVFGGDRLIPLHDPQKLVVGVVRVENAASRQQFVTLKSVPVQTEFQSQYLPQFATAAGKL
jgi:hypothetical protein